MRGLTIGNYSGLSSGGYNGGGSGYYYGAGGGGATHISFTNGLLRNIGAANKHQVLMVAGGGGGGYHYYSTSSSYAYQGGYGGGNSGGSGSAQLYYGTGGSQNCAGYSSYSSSYCNGGFGYGGSYYSSSKSYGTGGGGGLYGGGAAYRRGSGGGGSGYVNPSYLTNYQTVAGNTSFASTTGSTEVGHSGNGYAKISYSYKVIDRIDSSISHIDVATVIYDTICRNDVYNNFGFSADGNNLSAGMHTYTHSNQISNKDSVTTLYLTIKQEASNYMEIESPYSYTWPVNGETYTESGIYSYMTVTPDGCDSTIVLALTIYDPTIGVSENEDAISLSVSPNPTKEYVDVTNNSAYNVDMHLYNMYGKKIVARKLSDKVTRISLNDYSAGTYFIRFSDGKKILKTEKIIILK